MSVSKISSNPLLEDGGLSKNGTEGGKEKDGSSSGPERPASPEVAKCAICLGDVVNRSCSNSCSHQFCFGCLLEWSKVKPECPLCKCSFRSIYHNFRSTNEYDEYVVPTPVPHLSIRFTASGPNYRLSPFIRVLEARAGHQHSPLGHAFEGVSIPAGMFQPHPAPVVLQTNPFNNGSSGRAEFFGDLISEHRRVQEEAIQMPGYQNRRRRYDRNEWVQPFGSTLQPGSVIFPSVEYIRSHPSANNRLRNWLYRELNVLLGLYRSRDQMAFVYDLIMHLINHYDIRSRDFRDMVSTYFGAKTAHFQHELYHFVLSGMTIEEYDRVAEYPSASSGRGSARRNAAPEIITLDSDDEGNSNRNAVQSRTLQSDDVILLETSSDEEGDSQSLRPNGGNGSSRNYTSISLVNPLAVQPGSSIPPMPDLTINSSNGSGRLDDREGAHRHNLDRAPNRDPDMPVLEPQVYPFIPLDNYPFGRDSTRIDRSRATAATTTVTTASTSRTPALLSSETINQNLTRPSVLSSSSSRLPRSINNDVLRLIEPEFDIDLDVSVESYSSPPRQASRPLSSPDFPILQLRRNIVDRDRDSLWERRRVTTVGSNEGTCPFAAFTNSNNRSGARGGENASAFVPYEPESSQGSREELTRPPRPSCIHGTTSGSIGSSLHLPVPSSASSRDYRSISPTPAFRIDLYPRGISSSQVMDLSRSAGLVSNASMRSNTNTTISARSPGAAPSCPPAVITVSSPRTPPLTSLLSSCVAGPSSASTHSTAISLNSLFSSSGSSLVANKSNAENNGEPSDSDELECLGSFPIEKKPPLAVITLSSDDEEELRVKAENKREGLSILSSDDDTNLLDGFMNWAAQPLSSSDFNLLDVASPSSPPIIDFQSSSSSSNFLPVVAPQQTTSSSISARSGTSSGSAVISIPTIPSFRLTIRNSSVQNSGESGTNKQPSASTIESNDRRKKKHKHSSPKKGKGRRARVVSSSEDFSDNEDPSPKCVQSQSSSASASPMKIPKKRIKYSETLESSAAPRFSTSESSDDSDMSSEDDDDSDYTLYDPRKGKNKIKKRSSPKKKHKSKSKKSKKTKKSKDKEKSRKTKRSSSKVKTSGSSDASSATINVPATSSSGSSRSRSKTKKGSSDVSSFGATASNSTVQAPTTSSSASFSFNSTSVMNMPLCDFEYPSGLLDLSFNNRTEDDTPLLPPVDDENTIDPRIPPPPAPPVIEPSSLSSTVDTSAIFGSPSRTIFNAFWDDYSSSSSVTERRSGSWVE